MAASDTDWITLVLTSSAIATVATTVLKLAFDTYVTPRLARSRNADAVVARLRPRLVEAAEEAAAYVRLLLRFRKRGWYSGDDPYFRASILYACGKFFAWYHHVQATAHPDFEESSRVTEEYLKFGNRTMKSLTGFGYQQAFSRAEKDALEGVDVPRRAIQAMGELMLLGGDKGEVIDFIDFADRIETDARFARWFGYLDKAFREIEAEGRHTLFHERFVLFAINLQVFVIKLHPKRSKRIDAPLNVNYLNDIDARSRARLLEEFAEEGIAMPKTP